MGDDDPWFIVQTDIRQGLHLIGIHGWRGGYGFDSQGFLHGEKQHILLKQGGQLTEKLLCCVQVILDDHHQSLLLLEGSGNDQAFGIDRYLT